MIAPYSDLLFRSLAVASLLVLVLPGVAADSQEMKIDARLVWGTNDEKSPNTNHTEVNPELAQKLQKTFKWKNYFRVSHQKVVVPVGTMKSVKMSEHCTIEVKNLGGGRVEVKLLGDGKLFGKCTNPLPEGDDLILGGDAENNTAWFVVLRALPLDKTEPQKPDKQPKANESKPPKESKDKPKQGASLPGAIGEAAAACVLKESPACNAL